MQVQFNSLGYYAKSFKLTTLVVFVFQLIKNCKRGQISSPQVTKAAIQEGGFELVQQLFNKLLPKMKKEFRSSQFDRDEDVTATVDPLFKVQNTPTFTKKG